MNPNDPLIEGLQHLKLVTTLRIQSTEASMWHLRDVMAVLVPEIDRLIAEHEAALAYDRDHLRRLDAALAGGPYVPPGVVAPEMFPQLNVETARLPIASQLPSPQQVGMTDEASRLAQRIVGAKSLDYGREIVEAVPIKQSKMEAVFYEPGDTRPPEALPGHLSSAPRSAEELRAARDADRKAKEEAQRLAIEKASETVLGAAEE